MKTALCTLIDEWAVSRGHATSGNTDASSRARVVVLDRDEPQGVITIMRVHESPPSFHISVTCGHMIVDESWADARGLPACLDMALRLLQDRRKAAAPQWRLDFREGAA